MPRNKLHDAALGGDAALVLGLVEESRQRRLKQAQAAEKEKVKAKQRHSDHYVLAPFAWDEESKTQGMMEYPTLGHIRGDKLAGPSDLPTAIQEILVPGGNAEIEDDLTPGPAGGVKKQAKREPSAPQVDHYWDPATQPDEAGIQDEYDEAANAFFRFASLPKAG